MNKKDQYKTILLTTVAYLTFCPWDWQLQLPFLKELLRWFYKINLENVYMSFKQYH